MFLYSADVGDVKKRKPVGDGFRRLRRGQNSVGSQLQTCDLPATHVDDDALWRPSGWYSSNRSATRSDSDIVRLYLSCESIIWKFYCGFWCDVLSLTLYVYSQ